MLSPIVANVNQTDYIIIDEIINVGEYDKE
jgi:hypothetical protein